MYKIYNIIHILFSFTQLFLALRVLFYLIRSSESNSLVQITYKITDPIVEIFQGFISREQRYKIIFHSYYLDLLPIFIIVVIWFADWLLRIILFGI